MKLSQLLPPAVYAHVAEGTFDLQLQHEAEGVTCFVFYGQALPRELDLGSWVVDQPPLVYARYDEQGKGIYTWYGWVQSDVVLLLDLDLSEYCDDESDAAGTLSVLCGAPEALEAVLAKRREAKVARELEIAGETAAELLRQAPRATPRAALRPLCEAVGRADRTALVMLAEVADQTWLDLTRAEIVAQCPQLLTLTGHVEWQFGDDGSYFSSLESLVLTLDDGTTIPLPPQYDELEHSAAYTAWCAARPLDDTAAPAARLAAFCRALGEQLGWTGPLAPAAANAWHTRLLDLIETDYQRDGLGASGEWVISLREALPAVRT